MLQKGITPICAFLFIFTFFVIRFLVNIRRDEVSLQDCKEREFAIPSNKKNTISASQQHPFSFSSQLLLPPLLLALPSHNIQPIVHHESSDVHAHQRARLHRAYEALHPARIIKPPSQLWILKRHAREQVRVRLPNVRVIPSYCAAGGELGEIFGD